MGLSPNPGPKFTLRSEKASVRVSVMLNGRMEVLINLFVARGKSDRLEMEAWKCVVFSQGAIFQADWPLCSSQSKSVSQTISRGYLQRKVVPCGNDSPKVDRIGRAGGLPNGAEGTSIGYAAYSFGYTSCRLQSCLSPLAKQCHTVGVWKDTVPGEGQIICQIRNVFCQQG